MKRFFAVIALALCVTIGGVYATWNYTATNDIMVISQTKALQMAGAAETGAAGAYTVDTSGLTLLVDDTNGDHLPELVGSGVVRVTFTPNQYAPDDIVQNGVTSYTKLDTNIDLATWVFDDGNGEHVLFTLSGATHTIGRADSGEEHKWTPVGDGTLYCEFEGEAIAQHITLYQFLLETKELYLAYSNVLDDGQLRFTVDDTAF